MAQVFKFFICIMQSFLVISSLFNVAAGATWKVNGFECHMARSCLKQEGLEIISYKRPIVQGWTLEDCQNKCKETDGCASIDIQEYKEGSDSRNLSLASQGIPPGYPNWDIAICTLYSLENTLVDSKGECHRGSGLLSCTALPPKESLNADQKLLGATWKVNGFECHMAR